MVKVQMDENLYKKAIYQILGEEIGFDEAKIYLDMLFSKKIFKNFSISKTYRILQKLYRIATNLMDFPMILS
ncbi:MAG: hypothetical protein QW117_03245 [Candidatus Pacearchaeota archaeon]